MFSLNNLDRIAVNCSSLSVNKNHFVPLFNAHYHDFTLPSFVKVHHVIHTSLSLSESKGNKLSGCILILVTALRFCAILSGKLLFDNQISQRLMVQGTSDAKKYSGGLDAAHKIIKADGIRGLYRGFGPSVMTYAPTSAVWWASSGAGQRLIWK